MNLRDFIKFFAQVTVCYYMDDVQDNFLVDQHEIGQWGMSKFTLERDNTQPLCITVDQISERFLDRPRNGSYIAPPIKIILTKLESEIHPDSEEVTTVQTFVGGDRK